MQSSSIAASMVFVKLSKVWKTDEKKELTFAVVEKKSASSLADARPSPSPSDE